jgi:hypothetical protein
LYEDSDLTELVTVESSFTNPDDETGIDGDAGATKNKLLYVAMERGFLAADINDSDDPVTITLAAARFSDTALNTILIGSEKLQITAGWGTTSLTATRGWDGTTKAAHTTGDAVILCYDIETATIVCSDNSGTDQADWISYCLAPAGTPDGDYNTHPAVLNLGDIDYDSYVCINRRLIVPASSAPVIKADLLHDTTGLLTEHSF